MADIREGHALDLITAFDGEAAEDAGMRAVGFDLNPGKPPALTYGDPAPGTLFNLFGEAS